MRHHLWSLQMPYRYTQVHGPSGTSYICKKLEPRISNSLQRGRLPGLESLANCAVVIVQ